MSEQNGNKQPETFITLELHPESREFRDLEELRNWLSEERSFFGWLEAGAKQDSSSSQAWNVTHQWHNQIDQYTKQYEQNRGNEAQQQNLLRKIHQQVNQVSTAGHLITSESPAAVFGKNLASKHGEVVASYALNTLLKIPSNQNKPEALLGAFLAFQYLQGSDATVETQVESLEQLKRRWSAKYSAHDKQWRVQHESFVQEIDQLRNQYASLKQSIEELQSEQKAEFDEKLSDSEATLKDIAKTYDEKLALQSSVSYWSNKRNNHNLVMWVMGIATLVVALSTASVFIYAAHTFLQVDLHEVDLWRISVMLAISTFGVWLTRLFAKIFLSNIHLRTDADERVTMIQTYLALLREGSGPKDGERQLILQTLFRPSSSGFFQDEGPASFHDVLMKFLSSKSP